MVSMTIKSHNVDVTDDDQGDDNINVILPLLWQRAEWKKGKDGAPAAIILDFVKTILFALLECANFLSRKSKPSCIFQLEPDQQRQQDFQKVLNLYWAQAEQTESLWFVLC